MATREGFLYGANHRPSNVRNCSRVPDEVDRQQCVAMQVMMTAQRLRKPELCDAIAESERRTYALCRGFFEQIFPHDSEMLEQAIPQRMNENILLAWDATTGRFTDETERAGVAFTGWSWNARFADVDNDEWQDIFIVAGSWFRATPSGTTANFFFHNEAGRTFSDQTKAFGLQNFMIVSAYTVVDFDRDGDLDFVTNSINGPLWLLRNNSRTGHSIAFELRDEVGNHYGIGTKITIHYGPDGGRHQLRELKASGGYISFDEPLAHFGLGEYTQVERLEISWSTGGKTVIPGPFEAG
ncbi:MAG: CRTAC1 family protein, partial [Gammaproteobacteria bacterium]